MTGVCREIGISSKSGYMIFDRDREQGMEGLHTTKTSWIDAYARARRALREGQAAGFSAWRRSFTRRHHSARPARA